MVAPHARCNRKLNLVNPLRVTEYVEGRHRDAGLSGELGALIPSRLSSQPDLLCCRLAQAVYLEAVIKGKEPAEQRLHIWSDILANSTDGLRAVQRFLDMVGTEPVCLEFDGGGRYLSSANPGLPARRLHLTW
jgi:hypothetical protein